MLALATCSHSNEMQIKYYRLRYKNGNYAIESNSSHAGLPAAVSRTCVRDMALASA